MTIGKCIYSEDFNLVGNAWCLKLYPGGEEEESKDFVSVFVFNCSDTLGTESVRVKWKLDLVDSKGEILDEGPLENDQFAPGGVWGIGKFVNRESELLARATKTTCCTSNAR